MVSFASLTQAQQKMLRPLRRVEGSARPPSAIKVERAVRAAYAKKQTYLKAPYEALFAAGLAVVSPLSRARKQAHELFTFTKDAVAKADLDTLAVAERALWYFGGRELSLASIVAETHDLETMLRMVARATELIVESKDGFDKAIYVEKRGDAVDRHLRYGEPTRVLRHVICALSDAAYATARKVASELRTESARSILSYSFPDEPWANEDLRRVIGAPKGVDEPAHWPLLFSASDLATVRAFAAWEKSFFEVAQASVNLALALPPTDAIALFAEALAALLVKRRYQPLAKTPPREVAEGLMVVGTLEAAQVLAAHATNPILAPAILSFFAERRDLGAALKGEVKSGSKLAEKAARVLAEPTAKAARAAPEREVPALLRDRPWNAKTKKEPALVVTGLAIKGLDREKVVLVHSPPPARDRLVRDLTSKELAKWRKHDGDYVRCDVDHERIESGGFRYIRIPAADGIAAWNELPSKKTLLHDGCLAWLAAHGTKVIPGFCKGDWLRSLDYDYDGNIASALFSIVSPRIAPSIARIASRRKKLKRQALAWLERNAELACLGLVPDAAGEKGEPRADAEKALLYLARHGNAEKAVRAAAKAHGKEAAKVIEALLARDPLAAPFSVPKPPPFLRPRDLPPVLLRSKKALDEDATQALLEMLALSTLDEPYAGLRAIEGDLDPASLRAFALELCEQWVLGDAKGRFDWMLYATVHLPSEAGTRRLASLARDWARRDQAKAERACAALAAIASDLALVHLAHIAATTRFAALKTTTNALLEEAAAARALTRDALADRTVPDVGLDPDGTLALDYGSRSFVVDLDAALVPRVRERMRDGSLGKPERALPRPTKTDDAARAKEARARLAALTTDLESIAKNVIRRLEQAMVAARTWSVSDFEPFIARHPLVSHLARGLVWEVVGKDTFRVAEDGSYADAKDSTVRLPASALVRLAHPARTKDLAKTWSQLFIDYDIIQPFEQLTRAAPSSADSEGIVIAGKRMLGAMEARGWARESAAYFAAWVRDVAGAQLRWTFAPPIEIAALKYTGDVTTGAISVVSADPKRRLTLDTLDPIARFELARDIAALRAMAS